MTTEICLLKVKKSVTRASIGRWFRRVGDPVSVDEPLVEIETDNMTIEVAASATGVLSEILVRDGETVETGTVLQRRLLKVDKRAFFTACSQASKAADYLRSLALAAPAERAA